LYVLSPYREEVRKEMNKLLLVKRLQGAIPVRELGKLF
jgi:hypothetical protein